MGSGATTMRIDVTLNHVYQRIGEVTFSDTYRADLTPSAVSADDYGLMFYWPRSHDWLRIRATHVTPPPGPREFRTNEASVALVCRKFQTTPERIRPVDQETFFRDDNLFGILDVIRNDPITLEISIDTDSRHFLDAVKNEARVLDHRPELDRELVVRVTFFAFDARSGTLLSEKGDLVLTLRPLRPLPPYEGHVALDLGNTSSSIVCLPRGYDSTRYLRVLRAEGERGRLEPDAAPPESHVRIDEVFSWPLAQGTPAPAVGETRRFPSRPHDDMPQAVRWVIGKAAATGLDGLVVGAKRLVAGPRSEEPIKLKVQHNRQDLNPPEVQQGWIDVLNRAPAELLACRLLQQFSRAAYDASGAPAGWPRHLALTYPTTFAPREIDRLRRAVHRAWLRLQFKRQQVPQTAAASAPAGAGAEADQLALRLQQRLERRAAASDEPDPLIPLLIDEASSAAFFFLFQKGIESPGGLATLRYMYDRGSGDTGQVNLLLYDCGGGTTDLALVSAVSDGVGLRIKVRGRSGVRQFGGDNITLAVCRILKAKFIRELMRLGRDTGRLGEAHAPELAPPSEVTWEDYLKKRPDVEKAFKAATAVLSNPEKADPEGLRKARAQLDAIRAEGLPAVLKARMAARAVVERFLADADRADPGDNLVPTRFSHLPPGNESARRREHANTLWNWGEWLKYHLGKGPGEKACLADVKVKLGPGRSKLTDELLRLTGGNAAMVQELTEKLEKVTVHRWEVDALVGHAVARSVRNANRLIRDELERPPEGREPTGLPDDEEMVHWVVVTGNGSLYPLVGEMLRTRLQVPNLDLPGRFTHEPANLKHAVAKGAALALAAHRGGISWRIDFDTELSGCLPYDVGYKNRQINNHDILFPQQQRYDRLGERPVPFVALREGGQTTTPAVTEFTLWRRFPGDGDGASPADGEPPDPERGWTKYATYRFADGIKNDLTVSYDAEKHEFVVRSGGSEGKLVDEGPDDDFRAPSQRGDW